MTLLPCPHCGPAVDETFRLEVSDEDMPYWAAVHCTRCQMAGPRVPLEEGEPGMPIEEEDVQKLFAAAAAAWNALPRRPA